MFIVCSITVTAAAWFAVTENDTDLMYLVVAFFALLSFAGWYAALALIVDYSQKKKKKGEKD